MTIQLSVNGQSVAIDAEPDTPLLWALRDHLGMTGTKFGCGQALCGACTVHVDGKALRACAWPLSSAAGKSVTTIETEDALVAKLKAAWIEAQVPQCGYCQPGFIMAAAALLKVKPQPTDAEIEAAITNLCRCGTYARIKKAIHAAASA